MVFKEIYKGIERQFAPPCEKYMNKIVDELRDRGVLMDVYYHRNDSSAWSNDDNIEISLWISHKPEDHTDCGFWARLRLRDNSMHRDGRTKEEYDLKDGIVRKYWGQLYGEEQYGHGDDGLHLMYPKKFLPSDTRFIYIEPHKLAQDLRDAVHEYKEAILKVKNKKVR